MELHERIYQLRKEKNMTQQDLADRLGVSRQAVSRWEMGSAKPELDSLSAISQIFGITVDELLNAEEIPEHNTGRRRLHLGRKSGVTQSGGLSGLFP